MLKKGIFLFCILFQTCLSSATTLPTFEEINYLFYAYEKDEKTIVHDTLEKYTDNHEALKKIALAHDDDKWTLLHYAAWDNNLPLIIQLISLLDSLNAQNVQGKTALHIAAELDHDLIIKNLIDAGANINAQDNLGNTPLHTAAIHGANLSLDLLLTEGASPVIFNKAKETILHSAILFNNHQGIYLLFAHQKKYPPLEFINIQNYQEKTGLHLAVEKKIPEICALLLFHGADPHIKDSIDQSPLSHAVKEFNISPGPESNTINSILYAYANEPHPIIYSFGFFFNHESRSIIEDMLSELQQKKKLYTFLSVFDQDGETALTSAIKYNLKTIIEILLRLGADPNLPNKKGNTPLIEAIKNPVGQGLEMVKSLINARALINMKGAEGYAPIHIAIIERDHQILSLLLKNQADLNSKAHQDITPLHLAMHKKFYFITHLLIHEGVPLNAISLNKWTPLHHAVASQSPAEVVQLIQHGALLDIQNKEGNTPLHMAMIHGNEIIIELLTKAGADCHIPNNDGLTVIQYAEQKDLPNILKLLTNDPEEQKQIPIEEIFEDSCDPFFASKPPCHADLRLVKQYLSHQSTFDLTHHNGETILHQAALSGNKILARKLIAAHHHINAKDDDGNSPLHKAISSLNLQVIQLLLNAGANPLLKNKYNQTPLDLASACFEKRKLFSLHTISMSPTMQKKYAIDSNKIRHIVLLLKNHIKKQQAQKLIILEKKIPIFFSSHFYNISGPTSLLDLPSIINDHL